MSYCLKCGRAVIASIPPGDNRPRLACDACGHIHYENPKIVVGCVVEHEGRILLCKRAIAPRYGYWTVPAGFMELNETLAEGALRETWEEALARVDLGELFAIVDVVHAGQVHVFFRASLATAEFGAGEETLESRLVAPEALPWSEIAFPSVEIALRRHLAIRGLPPGPPHLAAARRLPVREI
jgi:ADP-ribose pyrophosphatase YjhB (NUDIX family)